MIVGLSTSKFNLNNPECGSHLFSLTYQNKRFELVGVSKLFEHSIDSQHFAVMDDRVFVLHHLPQRSRVQISKPGVESFDFSPDLRNVEPENALALVNHELLKFPASIASSDDGMLAVAINGQDFIGEIFLYSVGKNPDDIVLKRRLDFFGEQQKRPVNMRLIGDELWVASYSSDAIHVFDIASSQNTPKRVIVGDRTLLSAPIGFYADDDLVWVTSHTNHSILAFNRWANGNCSPEVVIAGDKTELDHPWGITCENSRLFVANIGVKQGKHPHISVFPTSASGNCSPEAQLSAEDCPQIGGVTNLQSWTL